MKISELTEFSRYYWLVDLESPEHYEPILPLRISNGALDYYRMESEETEHLYVEEWEFYRLLEIPKPNLGKIS